MVPTSVCIRRYTVVESETNTQYRSSPKDSRHYANHKFLHHLWTNGICACECIFEYYGECVAIWMALGNWIIGIFGHVMQCGNVS